MSAATQEVSVKGRLLQVSALRSDDGSVVVIGGRFVRIGSLFDEYWVSSESIPDPHRIVRYLAYTSGRPDLFTFAQRIPQAKPLYDFKMEWDNVAAIPISTYEEWLHHQVSAATRRNVRASEKKEVVVKVSEYDRAYVEGIVSIVNESPIRQGRRYWHYGKQFDEVELENGTYRDRSTYLGAYLHGEMIGYMKIVWDKETAAIMQVLSKLKFRDKRPNNALMAGAVKQCVQRGVHFLLYNEFVYGNKGEDSLTRFKRENGFVRMDVPRYYVPLTVKGAVALSLGLHRNLRDLMPQGLRRQLSRLRDRWYSRHSVVG